MCSKFSNIFSAYKLTADRERIVSRKQFTRSTLCLTISRSSMAERLPSSKNMLRSRGQDERSERRRMSIASSRDEEIEETLQRIQKQGKYIKLNVGGVLYCTTLGTLTKHDNMLRAMFSERIPLQKDDEGEPWWASNRIKRPILVSSQRLGDYRPQRQTLWQYPQLHP